jgi:hypothetical protein
LLAVCNRDLLLAVCNRDLFLRRHTRIRMSVQVFVCLVFVRVSTYTHLQTHIHT